MTSRLSAEPLPPPVLVPAARTATLALAGLTGTALSAVLVAMLHVVVDPADVDPVRRTISEYALGEHRPLFDAGVLLLAVGSAVVLVALVAARLLPALSTASALLAAWSAALVVVVAFPKIDWSVGPTPAGYLHRYASLFAFVCLPVAGLLLARQWRAGRWARYAGWTRGLSALSLAWLAPILLGVALRPLTGVPWWRFVPLGLVERGLAVTEVALVCVLGWWAWLVPRVGAHDSASRGLRQAESGLGATS